MIKKFKELLFGSKDNLYEGLQIIQNDVSLIKNITNTVISFSTENIIEELELLNNIVNKTFVKDPTIEHFKLKYSNMRVYEWLSHKDRMLPNEDELLKKWVTEVIRFYKLYKQGITLSGTVYYVNSSKFKTYIVNIENMVNEILKSIDR